jgi:hypothetical protein
MIEDPERRGQALATFYREVAPRLFHDLEQTGALGERPSDSARDEWECFALYACVRGLVAAGGFNRETGRALDAFHQAVLGEAPESDADSARLRSLVARRYEEYGAIGQAGGAAGAGTVTERLGARAAEHMAAPSPPPRGLAERVGDLHESLVEGATESVRQAE